MMSPITLMPVIMATLFNGFVLFALTEAAADANSKLNQYANMEDWYVLPPSLTPTSFHHLALLDSNHIPKADPTTAKPTATLSPTPLPWKAPATTSTPSPVSSTSSPAAAPLLPNTMVRVSLFVYLQSPSSHSTYQEGLYWISEAEAGDQGRVC